jgi:hypothetical protein
MNSQQQRIEVGIHADEAIAGIAADDGVYIANIVPPCDHEIQSPIIV